jgi:anti-sigma regulatory factor (Ser/Thr protein kinase)
MTVRTKRAAHHTGHAVKKPLSLKVTLPRVPGIELVALQGLEHLGRQCGIAAEKIGEARIIVTEAIINAFEHGGTDVRVEFTMSADELTVFVHDSGKGFDPSRVKERPDVAGNGMPSRRGWGMKLIRRLSDGFEISSGKRGTTITITKRLS